MTVLWARRLLGAEGRLVTSQHQALNGLHYGHVVRVPAGQREPRGAEARSGSRNALLPQ
jgi:hypothetical protein